MGTPVVRYPPPLPATTPTAGDSVEPQQRQWLMPAMLVAALVVFAIAAWRLLSPTPAPVAAPTFDPVAIERWVRRSSVGSGMPTFRPP